MPWNEFWIGQAVFVGTAALANLVMVLVFRWRHWGRFAE